MASALIGYTGFVGSNLRQQATFDEQFNSKNIEDIRGKKYDLLVCAGAPAAKWVANQDPQADLANLQSLMAHLQTVAVDDFVLISTIDVYHKPLQVDESTPVQLDSLHAYGTNRYALEEFARATFQNLKIVRLPGLFGPGLRKNFLFDVIHNGESPWTHCDSVFQFYDVTNLWRDLQVVRHSEVTLVNFATEPVRAGDVARHALDMDYTFHTENPAVDYDMQTQHADLFGRDGRYILTAEETYAQIRAFAQNEKRPAS